MATSPRAGSDAWIGSDGSLAGSDGGPGAVSAVVGQAVPSIAANLLWMASDVLNLAYLGHAPRSATEAAHLVAGAGLAMSVYNCCVQSCVSGVLNSFDSLISQAWGANDKKKCVDHLMRLRVILIAVLPIFFIPLFFFAERALLYLGQDPTTARLTQEYLKIESLAMFANFQVTASRKFLRNISHVWTPVLIFGISASLHVGWGYLFVIKWDMGVSGAAIAAFITHNTLLVLFHYSVVRLSPELGVTKRHLLVPTRESLRGWMQFFETGLPAMLQLCLEWWFWEITVILSGFVSPAAQAIQVTLMNLANVVSLSYVSISGTVATVVGQAIGAQQPRLAKKRVMYGILFALLNWCGLALTLLWLPIVNFYTPDPKQRESIKTLMPLVCLVFGLDSIQNVLGGVCRAIGYYKTAAWIYVLAFYGVGMPAVYYFVFMHSLGVAGFWYAFACAIGSAMVAFVVVTSRANFREIAEAVAEEMLAGHDTSSQRFLSGDSAEMEITPRNAV